MRRLGKAWVIALPLAMSACALVEGLGDLQIVDSDDAGPIADAAIDGDATIDARSDGSPITDASSDNLDAGMAIDAADTAPPNRCPFGRGPVMVEAPTIDGRTYCIDSTEVTQAQYKAFLTATAADASGQDTTCTWNDSYAPRCDYAPDTNPNRPVACVDWCDALAFCAWAGKRMCGKIGGGALGSFFGGAFDPNVSQWHAACTHNGERTYPYGADYDGSACNGKDLDAGSTVEVASLPGCVGGFAGLHDMSGNVGEWENGCDENEAGPRQGVCHARGCDYGSDSNGLKCNSNGVFLILGRDYTDSHVGIRCCAD